MIDLNNTPEVPESPRPRSRFGMRLILSVTVSALVTATVIGVGSVAERNAREALRFEMQTRLLLEARHLALLSADALLTDFPELTLVPVVREMQAERSDLAFAVVLDHEGVIQGHDDPRKIGQDWSTGNDLQPVHTQIERKPQEIVLGNAEVLVARVPVHHVSGRRVGSAAVGLRRSHLEAMVTSARRELILVTAAMLVAAILISILIMRRMLRPVGALQAGLERIGRGDLDTPMHLKDRTELGQLADTINGMAGQLKANQKSMLAKEQEIIETQAEVIHTMGEVVETRSHETANHTVRVGQYAYRLAILAGLGDEEAQLMRRAAPMHDIGKIGISDAVLNKPGRYTPEEHDLMKRHAVIGYTIFKSSKRPVLQAAAIIAHEHHERWDGNGYPRGLSGEDIHIYGRIVAVADVFDALSFDRVYRKAMTMDQVLKIMREGRGTHFDPNLLDLFFEHLDEFVALKKSHQDSPVQKNSLQSMVVTSPPPIPTEQAETDPKLQVTGAFDQAKALADMPKGMKISAELIKEPEEEPVPS